MIKGFQRFVQEPRDSDSPTASTSAPPCGGEYVVGIARVTCFDTFEAGDPAVEAGIFRQNAMLVPDSVSERRNAFIDIRILACYKQ